MTSDQSPCKCGKYCSMEVLRKMPEDGQSVMKQARWEVAAPQMRPQAEDQMETPTRKIALSF